MAMRQPPNCERCGVPMGTVEKLRAAEAENERLRDALNAVGYFAQRVLDPVMGPLEAVDELHASAIRNLRSALDKYGPLAARERGR